MSVTDPGLLPGSDAQTDKFAPAQSANVKTMPESRTGLQEPIATSGAYEIQNKKDAALTERVRLSLDYVFDPEYPDISIVDLGLVEEVSAAENGTVTIGLIPTFSGCPALAMIANDVADAVEKVAGVTSARVTWLTSPVWTTERTSMDARRRLSREYTVVLRRKDGSLRCPVCGSDAVTDQSMAGPTRCRSIAWCSACRNPVEVMR